MSEDARPRRGSRPASRLQTRKRRIAGLTATLLFAATAAAQGQAQAQEGDFGEALNQQPTSYLLTLYTDAGAPLKERGLLPPDWNPPQEYAAFLLKKALTLQPGADRTQAVGAGGVRFRIAGIRLLENEAAALDGLDATAFDRLAVVIFDLDYGIERALVLPSDKVAGALSGGALTLTEALMASPGVEDVTARVYRHAGEDFR